MPKLIFNHGKTTFHYSFGIHPLQPHPKEIIDPTKVDALVIEENLLGTPQAAEMIYQISRRNKPVYYVENRELHKKSGSNTKQIGLLMALGLLLSLNKKTRGISSTLSDYGMKLLEKEKYYGLNAGSVATMVLLPQREITMEEWRRLPPDVPNVKLIATRNAVIAEALIQLSRQYSRIGMIAGKGHYYLPAYIKNEELRKRERKGIEPEIRKL